MLNWLLGDSIQKTKKDLIVLDRFANILIEDLDKHNIAKARKHSEFILNQIKRLNCLADNSFGEFRDIAQVNKLKNLVVSNGFIFKYADELNDEINRLPQQGDTEQKLSLIKSHVLQLDKSFKAAEELADWLRKNEKFIKKPKSRKPIPYQNIFLSSVAAENVRYAAKITKNKLENVWENIENDAWRRSVTKSYKGDTDLLGLERKGGGIIFRLTYYILKNQIRVCEIYTNRQEYERDINGAKRSSNYGGFRPLQEILKEAS